MFHLCKFTLPFHAFYHFSISLYMTIDHLYRSIPLSRFFNYSSIHLYKFNHLDSLAVLYLTFCCLRNYLNNSYSYSDWAISRLLKLSYFPSAQCRDSFVLVSRMTQSRFGDCFAKSQHTNCLTNQFILHNLISGFLNLFNLHIFLHLSIRLHCFFKLVIWFFTNKNRDLTIFSKPTWFIKYFWKCKFQLKATLVIFHWFFQFMQRYLWFLYFYCV